MTDRHLPIAPVEIPRPPVPQPPERLYLFVCDSEDPTPAGRFWAHARRQTTAEREREREREQAELYLQGQVDHSAMQQAAIDGALYGYASQGRRETLTPPKPPVFRRATPDDLLAFGFGAVRSAPDLEPEQIMAEFITKLPGRTQVTLLRLLQERYGDGP